MTPKPRPAPRPKSRMPTPHSCASARGLPTRCSARACRAWTGSMVLMAG
ncbi:hypothetical protein ACFPRL_22560 [Pseudoclavibacter helvolus]